MKTRNAIVLVLLLSSAAHGAEVVTFKHQGAEKTVAGRLLVEADDGVLLLGPDTTMWALEASQIVKREQNDQPFALLDRAGLGKALLSELPADFRLHATKNYLICYNTSRAYAQWCGGLYERLHTAFYDHWRDRGVKLAEPESPLLAILFKDKESYLEFARAALGDGAVPPLGHYNLATNRMLAYDLTGVEGAGLGDRPGAALRINQILSRPEGERTVATIIHEATHQLAFNSGLHHRRADIPFWLSEGMAMYFETPDLKAARGWKRVGAVNQLRLLTFRTYLKERPADALVTLLTRDTRFRDPTTAEAAYAEAWALTFFLQRTRGKEYAKYLEILAKKGPLEEDSPDQRLADFQSAFGEDLANLDAQFLKYVAAIRF